MGKLGRIAMVTDDDKLLHLSANNPALRVSPPLRQKLARAQGNRIEQQFKTASQLCVSVFEELKLKVSVPAQFREKPVLHLADMEFSQLISVIATMLRDAGIPEEAIRLQAVAAAQRLHLVRAFDEPDRVVSRVAGKVAEIVNTFPRSAKDIECGRNPGDVLDPYILAATQLLLHGGDYTRAIATTVGHKALMIIEGLLGHLHEDVIGEMRGNVRVPEPRGKANKDQLDLINNPFPGADIVQPPYQKGGKLRFHQVKSKTGSAKGGDGRRLGEQLNHLCTYYDAEIFYDALIGNTLRGHRSRGAVQRAAPDVVVLVGNAAFRELTNSDIGPQLLLRVYQAAFTQVAAQSGYRVDEMADAIVTTFSERASKQGETFIESILLSVTTGDRKEQDSRFASPESEDAIDEDSNA